jgi:spore coat protein I
MEDKITDLLAQYDLVVYRAGRVKGAWMLETDRGLKCLGGCSYSEGKVAFEQKVKRLAAEHGFPAIDLYVENKEQGYLVQGPYNEHFVMRNWFHGEELNALHREHILRTAETLARLHNSLEGLVLTEEERNFCLQPKVSELLERRNKELRRVRAYIRSKKQKSLFEQNFLAQFDVQFSLAEEAAAMFNQAGYERYYNQEVDAGSMLHGNFTHHSVLLLPEGGMAVTGFEKAVTGIRIQDFYLLFRKIMEKWDWDISLGEDMLEAYQRIRPIPKEEWQLLKLLLVYPEKFWKVANQYYNNRKSWIPEKNMQKLLQTMEQADKKEENIKKLFT